jgi:hypothetical protein
VDKVQSDSQRCSSIFNNRDFYQCLFSHAFYKVIQEDKLKSKFDPLHTRFNACSNVLKISIKVRDIMSELIMHFTVEYSQSLWTTDSHFNRFLTAEVL